MKKETLIYVFLYQNLNWTEDEETAIKRVIYVFLYQNLNLIDVRLDFLKFGFMYFYIRI